jgi:hypothetical protein
MVVACAALGCLTSTLVFGRNAQIPVIHWRLRERVISDPLLPFPVGPVREKSAKSGPSAAVLCTHPNGARKALGFGHDRLNSGFGSIASARSSSSRPRSARLVAQGNGPILQIARSQADRRDLILKAKRIPFRIGVNLGDILIEGDDILGDGVNIAARLEGFSEPGGPSLSSAAYEQIRDRLKDTSSICARSSSRISPNPTLACVPSRRSRPSAAGARVSCPSADEVCRAPTDRWMIEWDPRRMPC